MPTTKRKIEVHHLTISGLTEGTLYNTLLKNIHDGIPHISETVMSSNKKSHSLFEMQLRNHRLRMRFMSYTKGYRPDIFDTNHYSLHDNPLQPNQTSVEWTHVVGNVLRDKYLLLIERNTSGIWPSTIEQYLQWLIDKNMEHADGDENITVSIETEPGEEFLTRLNALDRVTEATIRIVRPNPGWRDLDNELGVSAQESDAHRAEIHMTARRKSTLSKRRGIIQWIKSKYEEHELDFASVKGHTGSRQDKFNTMHLGKHYILDFNTDNHGQVKKADAWRKLDETIDEME